MRGHSILFDVVELARIIEVVGPTRSPNCKKEMLFLNG
jgi:hypothetical protein